MTETGVTDLSIACDHRLTQRASVSHVGIVATQLKGEWPTKHPISFGEQ